MDPRDHIKVLRKFQVRTISSLITNVRNHKPVFAGRDASRALAQSSLKEEECRPDWYDLSDEHKKVLGDWYTFFSKRYNIKGKVEGATNT